MNQYVTFMKFLILAILIDPASGAIAQPVPGQPDPTRGMALATKLCSNCHIGKGIVTQGCGQPVDVPTFSEIANRPDQTAERIHGKLIMPRHPMPTIPLTENEMTDLVAYILSLKAAD